MAKSQQATSHLVNTSAEVYIHVALHELKLLGGGGGGTT